MIYRKLLLHKEYNRKIEVRLEDLDLITTGHASKHDKTPQSKFSWN